MQANDAMRILGSAAAMGLLGGGSALAYNAISQPTLDKYGNVIESNDINPIATALGGAVVGGLGGYGYGKMNPASVPIPEEHLETFRTQTKPVRQVRYQNEIDDLRKKMNLPPLDWNDRKYINTRTADIPDKELFKPPAGYEGSAVMVAKDGKRYVRRPGQDAMWELIDEPTQQTQTPQVQIVPANPMKPQNPMSLLGMKTVVVQPMKEPGQEMMEEALRLRELARQQGNPSVPYDVFGESDGYWEAQKKRA